MSAATAEPLRASSSKSSAFACMPAGGPRPRPVRRARPAHRQRPSAGSSSARTAPASRRCWRRSPASFRSPPARCASTAARSPPGRRTRSPDGAPGARSSGRTRFRRRCARPRSLAPRPRLPAGARLTESGDRSPPSTGCCDGSISTDWPTSTCRRSPAASGSGSRSRPRCSRKRRCCCSTSRRRISTRRTSACCSRLLADHARQGGAVVASLHDLNLAWDLADHARPSTARAAPSPGRATSVLTAERIEPRCSRSRSRASSCTARARFVTGAGRGGSARCASVAASCGPRHRASARRRSRCWLRSRRGAGGADRRRRRRRPRRCASSARRQRIVTLAPSLTELVFAAGGGAAIVGRRFEQRLSAAARAIPRIGDVARIDVERLLALKPGSGPRLAARQHQPRARAARGRRHPPVPARAAAARRRRRAIERLGQLLGTEATAGPAAAALRERARGAAPAPCRRCAGAGLLPGVVAAR